MTSHSEHLEVRFTDAEKLEMGRDVARLNQEKRRLDQKLTEIKKQLTGEISGKETEIDRLMDLLSNGYEYRQVECRIDIDTPKQGLASIIRLDTEEVVRVRRMTDEEMQIQLPLEEAPPEPEPVIEAEVVPVEEIAPVEEVAPVEEDSPVAGPLREYRHSKNGGSCELTVYRDDVGAIRVRWSATVGDETGGPAEEGKAYETVDAAAKDGLRAIWAWAYAINSASSNPVKRAASLSVAVYASDRDKELQAEAGK